MFARVGNDDRHIQRSRFKVVGAEGAQLIGKMDGSNQGLQKDCWHPYVVHKPKHSGKEESEG